MRLMKTREPDQSLTGSIKGRSQPQASANGETQNNLPDAVYPRTDIQLCIVHMVRHSLNYVSWKLRKELAADLRRIYTSATLDEAEQRLTEFEAKWGEAYLPISQSWRHNWTRITPFFDYPPEIRKVIYTTNAIENELRLALSELPERQGEQLVARESWNTH